VGDTIDEAEVLDLRPRIDLVDPANTARRYARSGEPVQPFFHAARA
jgi:hypothetical protein